MLCSNDAFGSLLGSSTMPEKMAASSCGEVETPVKQCITVLDKKVRNLEKRKVSHGTLNWCFWKAVNLLKR